MWIATTVWQSQPELSSVSFYLRQHMTGIKSVAVIQDKVQSSATLWCSNRRGSCLLLATLHFTMTISMSAQSVCSRKVATEITGHLLLPDIHSLLPLKPRTKTQPTRCICLDVDFRSNYMLLGVTIVIKLLVP
jgi:hypothetical protein